MQRNSFFLSSLALVLVVVWQTTGQAVDYLVMENGHLVRYIDNCTVGDPSTCKEGFCCTREALHYPSADAVTSSSPSSEIKCSPMRQRGEFCYYQTPESFCPCLHTCASNGFYGHCT